MSRPPLRVSPALPAAAPLSFLRRKKLTICRQCSGGMHLSARARKMADHGSTAPRSGGMKPRSAKAPPRGREGSDRIIGGRWRGPRLAVPDRPRLRTPPTRPTVEKDRRGAEREDVGSRGNKKK